MIEPWRVIQQIGAQPIEPMPFVAVRMDHISVPQQDMQQRQQSMLVVLRNLGACALHVCFPRLNVVLGRQRRCVLVVVVVVVAIETKYQRTCAAHIRQQLLRVCAQIRVEFEFVADSVQFAVYGVLVQSAPIRVAIKLLVWHRSRRRCSKFIHHVEETQCGPNRVIQFSGVNPENLCHTPHILAIHQNRSRRFRVLQCTRHVADLGRVTQLLLESLFFIPEKVTVFCHVSLDGV
mmetsp:Transcript_23702/g.37990  ORF Transcript_23702/g.37990 Transcript_23702/m.37990 type:complete len:234 (+) Transcript_23702:698-1399(+)